MKKATREADMLVRSTNMFGRHTRASHAGLLKHHGTGSGPPSSEDEALMSSEDETQSKLGRKGAAPGFRGTPKGRGSAAKASKWDWTSPPAGSASGRGSGKRGTLSGSPAAHTQPTTPAERGRRGWNKGGRGGGADGGSSGDEAAGGLGSSEDLAEGMQAGEGEEGRAFCAVVSGEWRAPSGFKLLELESAPPPDLSGKVARSGAEREAVTLSAREWLPHEDGCDGDGEHSARTAWLTPSGSRISARAHSSERPRQGDDQPPPCKRSARAQDAAGEGAALIAALRGAGPAAPEFHLPPTARGFRPWTLPRAAWLSVRVEHCTRAEVRSRSLSPTPMIGRRAKAVDVRALRRCSRAADRTRRRVVARRLSDRCPLLPRRAARVILWSCRAPLDSSHFLWPAQVAEDYTDADDGILSLRCRSQPPLGRRTPRAKPPPPRPPPPQNGLF